MGFSQHKVGEFFQTGNKTHELGLAGYLSRYARSIYTRLMTWVLSTDPTRRQESTYSWELSCLPHACAMAHTPKITNKQIIKACTTEDRASGLPEWKGSWPCRKDIFSLEIETRKYLTSKNTIDNVMEKMQSRCQRRASSRTEDYEGMAISTHSQEMQAKTSALWSGQHLGCMAKICRRPSHPNPTWSMARLMKSPDVDDWWLLGRESKISSWMQPLEGYSGTSNVLHIQAAPRGLSWERDRDTTGRQTETYTQREGVGENKVGRESGQGRIGREEIGVNLI